MVAERRTKLAGRRIQDTVCGDHKWMVETVGDLNVTVKSHTTKLNKFLGRVNATLITMLLALLGLAADIIIRFNVN